MFICVVFGVLNVCVRAHVALGVPTSSVVLGGASAQNTQTHARAHTHTGKRDAGAHSLRSLRAPSSGDGRRSGDDWWLPCVELQGGSLCVCALVYFGPSCLLDERFRSAGEASPQVETEDR